MLVRTFRRCLALFLAMLAISCGDSGDSGDVNCSCGGKECGDDGCGGSCGECRGGSTCQDGQCSGAVSAGTWKDPASGLTWQNPPSADVMSWSQAKQYCSDLDGGSWRLPTIGELRSLIRGCPATESGGSCGVDDDCLTSSCRDESCYGCDGGSGPANGCYWPDSMQGECTYYWSSSPVEDDGDVAWYVAFSNGYVTLTNNVGDDTYVRCVR